MNVAFKQKLFVIILCVGLLPLTAAVVVHTYTRNILGEKVFSPSSSNTGVTKQQVQEYFQSIQTQFQVISVVAFVLLSFIAFVVTRRVFENLGADPKTLSEAAKAIANNELDTDFENIKGEPLKGIYSDLQSIQKTHAALKEYLESNQKTVNESLRLNLALDSVSSNVMMADVNGDLIYINDAAVKMLDDGEKNIRMVLPDFSVKEILGKNIDLFHKNPSHQGKILNELMETYKNEINIGERTYVLTASPVIDKEGERLGTVVEWIDLTAELAVESEVEDIVILAKSGNFGERINESNKTGFMRNLAIGINALIKSVTDPIYEVQRVMKTLADGDLTQSMQGDFSGEFANLRDATNLSIKNLFNMVNAISQSAERIKATSSEISVGNVDLSQRTEEQSAALEETAASMEEMTSTVKQNADNAGQANQLAVAARGKAEMGGQVMTKAVHAMSAIDESSKQISDIIGVIDEIAFQANLLALNAAVEAARAGEQGRGFAVVAGEVHNLAQRSAGAAKEIKSLIKDSVQKVDEGSRLVDESGQMLE